MEKDKTWLIFPMLAYVKYVDGINEITVGWLNKTFTIKWSINKLVRWRNIKRFGANPIYHEWGIVLRFNSLIGVEASSWFYDTCRLKSCPNYYKKTFGILENLIYLCCIIKTKT